MSFEGDEFFTGAAADLGGEFTQPVVTAGPVAAMAQIQFNDVPPDNASIETANESNNVTIVFGGIPGFADDTFYIANNGVGFNSAQAASATSDVINDNPDSFPFSSAINEDDTSLLDLTTTAGAAGNDIPLMVSGVDAEIVVTPFSGGSD